MQITCTSAIRTVKKHIWKLILPQIFHSCMLILGNLQQILWALPTKNLDSIYFYFHCYHCGQSLHHLSDGFLTNWSPSFHHCTFLHTSLQINYSYIFKSQILPFFCSKSSNNPYPTPWKTKVIVTVCYLFSHLNFSLYNHCCNQTDSWTIS